VIINIVCLIYFIAIYKIITMTKFIYLFIYLSIYTSISLNGQVINSNGIEKGTSIQRNATYNLEEIKVRWKKAALENCTGVPCVTAPSFTCGTSTVSDLDGNSYNTVLIGTQCWTKENLKVTKYNDGTLIPDSTSSTWGTAAIGARTGYVASGVSNYVGTFGYLYNWYAATDSRKICPTGWHVPTDTEWTTLTNYLGGLTVASTVMKKNDALWMTNTGTNASGFSGLPGGYRAPTFFSDIYDIAYYWSATEVSSTQVWVRYLASTTANVTRFSSTKKDGFSVRCLRD